MSALRNSGGGDRPWQPPVYVQPIAITGGDLRPLGKLSGRQWYVWAGREVAEHGDLLDPTSPALPNGPLLKVWRGDDLLFQPLATFAPGTFRQRTTTPPPVTKRAPEPHAPNDALNADDLLTQKSTHHSHADVHVRGAQAIVERYASKGIQLRLSVDQRTVFATGPGGRILLKYHANIERLAPLVLLFLRDGRPPDCAVSKHPEPVAATTLAAPSTAWCGHCGQP